QPLELPRTQDLEFLASSNLAGRVGSERRPDRARESSARNERGVRTRRLAGCALCRLGSFPVGECPRSLSPFRPGARLSAPKLEPAHQAPDRATFHRAELGRALPGGLPGAEHRPAQLYTSVPTSAPQRAGTAMRSP